MSDREIKPEVKDDPLFQMLRHEDVDGFNKHRETMVSRCLLKPSTSSCRNI